MIFADCKIMGGDSGGPLFDLEGRVIGIGSRCDDDVLLNINVPIDSYRKHWDRLVGGEDFNSRSPRLAFLGVSRMRTLTTIASIRSYPVRLPTRQESSQEI